MRYTVLLTTLAASTTVYGNVIARQETTDPDVDDPTPTGVDNPFGNTSPECMSKLAEAAAAAPTQPPELQSYFASQGLGILTNLCSLSIPASLTAAESSFIKSMSSFQSKNAALISSCVSLDPALMSQMSIFSSAYRADCSGTPAHPTGSADATGDAGATTNGGATKTGSSGPAQTGSSGGSSAPAATSSASSGGKGGDDKPKKNGAGQIAAPAAGLLAAVVAALF